MRAAVQIVAEVVSQTDQYNRTRSYTSYELNLVLRDGRRLNVIDHAHYPCLLADAEALAAFLRVPVWDAG